MEDSQARRQAAQGMTECLSEAELEQQRALDEQMRYAYPSSPVNEFYYTQKKPTDIGTPQEGVGEGS